MIPNIYKHLFADGVKRGSQVATRAKDLLIYIAYPCTLYKLPNSEKMRPFNMLVYLFHTILIPMLLVQFSCDICDAFYVPGVAPQDFAENDKIDVRAIKMTSSHTQLPYEYYSLPFCKPPGEIVYKSQVSLVFTHIVLINRTKIFCVVID